MRSMACAGPCSRASARQGGCRRQRAEEEAPARGRTTSWRPALRPQLRAAAGAPSRGGCRQAWRGGGSCGGGDACALRTERSACKQAHAAVFRGQESCQAGQGGERGAARVGRCGGLRGAARGCAAHAAARRGHSSDQLAPSAAGAAIARLGSFQRPRRAPPRSNMVAVDSPSSQVRSARRMVAGEHDVAGARGGGEGRREGGRGPAALGARVGVQRGGARRGRGLALPGACREWG